MLGTPENIECIQIAIKGNQLEDVGNSIDIM